jgi:hypothetical protein
MCSAQKNWHISSLYPYLESLYEEVTYEQGTINNGISITKLKKDDFYIPRSQLIGEVFDDLD